MKAAFYSFMKAKSQYDAEMDEVSKVSDEIDLGLDGEAKDVKIADFADKKRRADQLRAIKDFKFEQLMKVIHLHYPDVAGSASSSSSKKGYALHEYKLPDGIFGTRHDPSIVSKMIAGLLQVSQAWIEDFYLVAVYLKRIQDNDSPFSPVD